MSPTHPTRREAGAVTAETALAMPVIALFAVSMVWVVALGLTHVRAVDAARETARAAARSDSTAQARSLGARVAPAGSTIAVRRGAGVVTVTVSSPVRGPAGLFARWSGLRVQARAVAAEERGAVGARALLP